MNERIKKLWSQAGGHYDSGNQHTWPQYTIDDPEKFAELISAEFIGLLEYEIAMLEKYKTAACNDFDRRWHEGKIVHFNKLIEKTKDHFGVKE
jgi:hypothetical protein